MVDVAAGPTSGPGAEPIEPGPIRGQHGRLVVRAERIAGRTRLTDVQQHPPLQVLRAHDLDPDLPDLATITIASPAGGVVQGDVLETEICVGPGARLSVGTQSATRIYRAPSVASAIDMTLVVEPDGYLEFLPDPYILFDGSRLRSTMTCVVAETATLIASDSLVGGRLARGERFGLDRFESFVSISRPSGALVATDAQILGPEPIGRLGRLGSFVAMGTLYVVAPEFDAATLREGIEAVPAGAMAGASDLPDGAGAWLRVLGPDARSVAQVLRTGWTVARRRLLGYEPAADRRP